MRADICNGVGEHVGALLFEKGCRMAIGLGLFINPLGLLFLFHLTHNHAGARNNLQRIHRRIIRQGKHIDAFNKGFRRIVKLLGDNSAGHRPCHCGCIVGGNFRRLDIFSRIGSLQQ